MAIESRDIKNLIIRLIAPISRRLNLIVSRGVVQLINESLKMQNVQINLVDGEVADNIEHFQEYGFTSCAQAGAEGLLASIGGVRAAGVVFCVSDRSVRPTALAVGEVVLFGIKSGSMVYLQDGTGFLILGAGNGGGVGTAPAATGSFVALAPNTESRIAALESAWATASLALTGAFGLVVPTIATFVPAVGKPVAATKVKAT